MYHSNDAKPRNDSIDEGQCLVLDGTANLDYLEDDQIPRVKGLIELLYQFIDSRD